MENKQDKKLKDFGLSTLSVNNRTTVFFVTFLIILFGVMSYVQMPKAAFPDIVLPQIYVGVAYPGNAPLDMEKLITKPIEKEVKSVNDVDKVTSTSSQGYSAIMVEFDSKISPTLGLQRIKDAVDKAKAQPGFPTDLPIEPNIFEMNFSEMPILNVNLSGDFSIDQLKTYAEYLEDELEDIPEISKVEIRGIQGKEVAINVDRMKIESMNIAFGDIENAIAMENLTIAGGELLSDNYRRAVRVVGDFKNIDEIGDIIVKREAQKVVYLKDVADVNFGFKEATSYAREFTKPVLMLDVIKKAGENLLEATDQIYAVVNKAQANRFPENLDITITNDLSSDTRAQVDNLLNSIIFGVLLVILVLMFFLGLKDAVFVGVAIPLSMLMSFAILNVMGTTINMIVLFSLILGLGMLVDNGIVVVENVKRLMVEGYSRRDAAIYGVGEIAWPIIASTATTLAAFFPMLFWPGMMGEFMGYLPTTLIIVLGSSLFVALFINPALTSFMSPNSEAPNKKRSARVAIIMFVIGVLLLFPGGGFTNTIASLLILSGIFTALYGFVIYDLTIKFQETVIPWLEARYQRFLSYALSNRKPIAFLLGTIGLFIFSIILVGVATPKVEFFPANMPKYVNVFIEKPIGSDIEDVNETTKEVEAIVINAMKKYEVTEENEEGEAATKNYLVKSIIAQVGAGTSDPAAGPALGETPNKARVQVSFVDFQFRRGVDTKDVMEEIREAVSNVPGISITVDKDAAGPPAGPPINIEIIGEDYEQLTVQAERLKNFINSKNIAGIEGLKMDIDIGKPELMINVDRAKARRLNLSTYQVAATLRTALYGKEVSRYKLEDDEYPINIRLKEAYRTDLDALLNQKITFRDQTNGQIRQIPISAVAKPVYGSTFSEVKRKNNDRLVTLLSNVTEGYNANEVVASIKEQIERFEVPDGVNVKFTGQQEEQAKEMAFLGSALVVAVFLIFLIIVAQFNSIGTPFIIIGSVGLSLIGVLLGLVSFQMDFIIIMTMIGIISLAGVVVNNSIVLLDYMNLLIERKKLELGLTEDDRLRMPDLMECIVSAGTKRLRPVLLTAITTILGLIPLAIGFNIDFFSLLSDFDPKIFMGGDNVIFWGPMSWTVIFGLTFATFLTLVIVPVMFAIKMKIKYKVVDKEIKY